MRLREEGITVDLVAEKPGKYHGKYGVPCEVTMTFDQVDPGDYDGVLVPGGWAPDKLRRFPKVLEIVKTFEEVNGVRIPYVIKGRRPGDIAENYASPLKAKEELGWVAENGIREMCEDSWRWQKNNPNGYDN